MEAFYRETFAVDDLASDRFGRLRPAMLLYYAQEVAGRHAALLGASWEDLAQKRLFWAVTRHRVQITRMPKKGETITLETWPMPTSRVVYPRAIAAYDADGNEVFRIISLWVLMDMDTRTMVLPAKSGVIVDGTVRGTELEQPHSLMPKGMTHRTGCTVTYSLLDVNGHMNNTRYIEWVDDLLDSTYHAGHTIEEFTVCYLSEAREGQQVELQWELLEGGCLQVDANREKPGDPGKRDRVFAAQVQYKTL